MEASRFDLLRIALLRGTNPMTWARLSFALALVVVGLLAQRDLSRLAYAADNPIVFENQQPGSGGWQLLSTASDVPGQVKGYASATSVNKGQPITFYVSVNPAQTYSIDVYRIGWYQGLGGRLLQHAGPFNGTQQAPCPTDPTTGMIACNWVPGYTLSVPSSWTSGIYLVVLTNAQNYQNYITFVVRDDTRVAALLYQQSVSTYQAYNNYPDDGQTGKSLYTYNSYGATTVSGNSAAVKVSFDRPYTGSGAGGGGGFTAWELYFVRWLERSGYDVNYSTNTDTHANGSRLLNYRGFLSVGHDEYWSKEMRDAAEGARDAAVGLAFFGANDVHWQIRFESSASGVSNRVIVCYRDATKDPVQGPTTVQFQQSPVNRPEQSLMGLQFNAQNNAYVSYVVTNSSHWVYAGTGFKDGNSVSSIVGYETDHQFSNFPLPNSVAGSYTLLSQSPVTNFNGAPDWANSSIYQAPSGAWVFDAGTIGWSFGLDNYGGRNSANAGIQQATANILNKFISSGALAGIAAPSNLTATAASAGTVNLGWTDNSTNENNFVIERSTDQLTWSVLTSSLPLNSTSYTDTVPSAGVYFYRVKATNTAGVSSSYSNTATVDMQLLQLLSPTGLSASSPTSSRVDLSWTDNAANETAYTVERSPNGSTNWSVLTSALPANTTSYSDTSVNSLTTYFYRVKATNATNSSGYSNTASITTGNGIPLGNVLIFDDGLSSSWTDWSYNINRNFNHTGGPAFSGNVDLQAQATAAWGAVQLRFNSGNFSTSGFSAINFALKVSAVNQPVGIFLNNGTIDLKKVDIRNYGGVVQNGWQSYSIPLSDLAAANTNIQNLSFQDWTGQSSNFPMFWLDQIYFLSGSPSPLPPPPPPPPPPPVSSFSIYADGLINGWQNWSWSSSENFNNTSPVFSGTNSIAFVVTAPWGGLYLHNETAISTSLYNTLHFAAQVTQAGQKYSVSLYDGNNALIKSVLLSNYGGDPTVASFRVYDIPLSDLGAVGKLIKGVQFQDALGVSQPTLYIDEIQLR